MFGKIIFGNDGRSSFFIEGKNVLGLRSPAMSCFFTSFSGAKGIDTTDDPFESEEDEFETLYMGEHVLGIIGVGNVVGESRSWNDSVSSANSSSVAIIFTTSMSLSSSNSSCSSPPSQDRGWCKIR